MNTILQRALTHQVADPKMSMGVSSGQDTNPNSNSNSNSNLQPKVKTKRGRSKNPTPVTATATSTAMAENPKPRKIPKATTTTQSTKVAKPPRKSKTKPLPNPANTSVVASASASASPSPASMTEAILSTVPEDIHRQEAVYLSHEQQIMAQQNNQPEPYVARTAPEGKLFEVVIRCVQSFKYSVDILIKIIDTLEIDVCGSEQFSGLYLACQNIPRTAAVVLQFKCETWLQGRERIFVDAASFSTLLNTANPEEELRLYVQGNKLYLATEQGLSFVPLLAPAVINTVVVDEICNDYVVKINLKEFRQVVKTASDLKATSLSLTIREPKQKRPYRIFWMTLGFQTDIGHGHQRHFPSVSTWPEDADENNVVEVKTLNLANLQPRDLVIPEPSDANVKLDEKYSISLLEAFLGRLRKPEIDLRVDSNGKPLVVYVENGPECSICLLLAALIQDYEQAVPDPPDPPVPAPPGPPPGPDSSDSTDSTDSHDLSLNSNSHTSSNVLPI